VKGTSSKQRQARYDFIDKHLDSESQSVWTDADIQRLAITLKARGFLGLRVTNLDAFWIVKKYIKKVRPEVLSTPVVVAPIYPTVGSSKEGMAG
jgi:predicted thioesterase